MNKLHTDIVNVINLAIFALGFGLLCWGLNEKDHALALIVAGAILMLVTTLGRRNEHTDKPAE